MYFRLSLVARHHLIGSQGLSWAPPFREITNVQTVVESSTAGEFNNVLQTLDAKNRAEGHTSYVLGHGIERVNCSPYKTIKRKRGRIKAHW